MEHTPKFVRRVRNLSCAATRPTSDVRQTRTIGIILGLAGLLLLSGCGGNLQDARFLDATKSETMILRKKPLQGGIHTLHISGRGEIDGTGEIQLVVRGSVYRNENVSGQIDFSWHCDWYEDTAELRLVPSSVRSGSIYIAYQFED